MGMSTNVAAFKPPGEEWAKMKRVWDACIDVGLTPPEAVQSYFSYLEPTEDGEEVPIIAHEWVDQDAAGYEILVKDIPEGVEKIRFYNSW